MGAETVATSKVTWIQFVILNVSRLYCIAPVKFIRETDGWSIRVSRGWSLFNQVQIIIMAMIMVVCVAAHVVYTHMILESIVLNYKTILWSLDVALTGLTAISAAYTGSNRMHHEINCTSQLEKINKKLNMYAYHKQTCPKERKRNILLWFLIISECIMIVVHYSSFVIDAVGNEFQVFLSSFYISCGTLSISVDLLVINFIYITTCVLLTLQTVNKCLLNLLQQVYNESLASLAFNTQSINKKGISTHPCNRLVNNWTNRVTDTLGVNQCIKGQTSKINQLVPIYCSLCNIIKRLDENNGLFALLVPSFALYVTMSSTYIIWGIMNFEIFCSVHYIIELLWVICSYGKFIGIFDLCHRVNEQMELTKHQINQMMCYTPPENIVTISELKRFSQHIVLNQVTYSPMQLFTINRSILISITSCIITYLVLINQFA